MGEDIRGEIVNALMELREALKPKAVVFDLDGVLVDSSRRYEKCMRETMRKYRVRKPEELKHIVGAMRDFWKCFLSEKHMNLDRPKPEAAKLVRSYLSKGYKIIILTGRVKQTQERKTRKQLKEWGIHFHEIVFRNKGDYRKDYEVKLEALEKLMEKYNVEIVYDDSEKFLQRIRSKFPNIKTYKVDSQEDLTT